MAATVAIMEKNGASGTPTNKTSGTIRFKNADNATVDLVNPMIKPATGLDYSYEKWVRLQVTGGTYSEITNIVAYTDGTSGMGTDISMYVKTSASYATPVEPTSTTGFTNLFTFTSGSPLSLGAGPYTGIGEIGLHMVMLMTVGPTASYGITPGESLTISWDEV